MIDDNNSDWRKVAAQIVKETDPDKLNRLIAELEAALRTGSVIETPIDGDPKKKIPN